MRRKLKSARKIGGTVSVPGDKSIAHRAALLSIIAEGEVAVRNFPDSADCRSSLSAAESLGVKVERTEDGTLTLTPPETLAVDSDAIVDCGNSGTTARLLAGLVSGSDQSVIIAGDESLSVRPMKRIVEPLTKMGAELIDTEGHLPLTVRGQKLLPFEYRLPVASAQVKSALLLAGLTAGCSVTVREEKLSRDHTELMIAELGGAITVRDIKSYLVEDPDDPRKKRRVMPEAFKRETVLARGARLAGGQVDIPGDISTASYFFAAAALCGGPVTVTGVGLNPTRSAILDYLKSIGCTIEITNRTTLSGELRGDVCVTGGQLKSRKISGELTVALIDEIPIVAVLAAFASGETIIRDAAELRVKETDRLVAIKENLVAMGVACGLLEDGLIIEGQAEPSGADFKAFGDHRIAMAFSVGALAAAGPSSIDTPEVVDISCPRFYDLLLQLIE